MAEEQQKTAEAAEPAPDYLDQLIRLKAEFENYRKRTDRERPEFVKIGKAEMLLKLLPVYDAMLKAHQEVQASHNDTPLARGMEGIFKEFEKLFRDEGISPMEPMGKPFDALQQEVLGTVQTEDDTPEGTVVDVLQNGFTQKDKVLRTAKVRIARRKTS